MERKEGNILCVHIELVTLYIWDDFSISFIIKDNRVFIFICLDLEDNVGVFIDTHRRICTPFY